MSSPFTARQAGIASLVAAGLIIVSQISQLVLPLTMPESFWIATQSIRMGLALVAMFALLVALTGLHARQASATGKLGLVGYLTASLGTLLIAGNWWYEAFIGPVLRQQAPELLRTGISGSILIGAALTGVIFAAGWVLFGIATFRAGIAPRGAAILMILAGFVGVLAQISPFQIPLAIAVGWMGLWLVRSTGRENQPASSRDAVTA
jgi:hypothetical protein